MDEIVYQAVLVMGTEVEHLQVFSDNNNINTNNNNNNDSMLASDELGMSRTSISSRGKQETEYAFGVVYNIGISTLHLQTLI